MRTLPHVTTVVDTTLGVFADVESARLPNGWSVSVPYTLFLDHEGFCWEGIGVPPYIRQVNTKEDNFDGSGQGVGIGYRLDRFGRAETPARGRRLACR